MVLVKRQNVWRCDHCGKEDVWGAGWCTKLILHKSHGGWDEELVACSDACAKAIDAANGNKVPNAANHAPRNEVAVNLPCYIFEDFEMTALKKLWIEHTFGKKRAIRIDWKNDRHQRIEIEDGSPEAVARALKEAGALVNHDWHIGKERPNARNERPASAGPLD